MIATLEGIVSEKRSDLVVLDVHGVGYGLLVTLDDYSKLVKGAPSKLFIHEHIREAVHDLYGFTTVDSQLLFEQLLSVKNVGPKVALAVLSIGSADLVRTSIAAGDTKMLGTAKGVGKRAAEQMVVELRDKVGLVVSDNAEGIVTRGGIGNKDEAVQALLALGFSEADALTALSHVDKSLSIEERVKQALKK